MQASVVSTAAEDKNQLSESAKGSVVSLTVCRLIIQPLCFKLCIFHVINMI